VCDTVYVDPPPRHQTTHSQPPPPLPPPINSAHASAPAAALAVAKTTPCPTNQHIPSMKWCHICRYDIQGMLPAAPSYARFITKATGSRLILLTLPASAATATCHIAHHTTPQPTPLAPPPCAHALWCHVFQPCDTVWVGGICCHRNMSNSTPDHATAQLTSVHCPPVHMPIKGFSNVLLQLLNICCHRHVTHKT
jgi:hypothetical protein